MYNIAIIGIGAIGKRHLESILKLKMPLNIYIVDNDKVAIETARILDEKYIIGGESVDILPKMLDIAIIATSSRPRRKVFEQLVTHSKVKYIIFEKVLFQRVEDYYEVDKILQENNIKAWVDCIRREMVLYQEIRKYIENSNYFTFNLTGGNWGLACNGIHFLDLIQFLANEKFLTVDEVHLLPMISESKRHGYKEVYGRISGQAGKCKHFNINCYSESNMPFMIDIEANDFRCMVIEGQNQMWYMSEKDGWTMIQKQIEAPMVSKLSQIAVENILMTGNCNLTRYEESMQLHLEFIKHLIKFFEDNGMEKGICPIT